jgi:hypothetical protein
MALCADDIPRAMLAQGMEEIIKFMACDSFTD